MWKIKLVDFVTHKKNIGKMKFYYIEKLRNYIRNFKENLVNKTPLEKWLHFRNFASIVVELSGCNLFDRNYRPTLMTAIPLLLYIDYFIFAIYTAYHYSWDAFRILQPIILTGLFIPVK